MSLLSLLILAALIAIIVGGLWVDYQCNWKKQEFRGFDVLPAPPRGEGQPDSGPGDRLQSKGDDHGAD